MKYKERWCVIVAVCLAASFLFAVNMVPLCFAADLDQAERTVREAEQDVGLAFVAVADAERIGVDVSALVNKLDAAVVFLSAAHQALDVQNYDSALSSAMAASSTVEGVIDDAVRLMVVEEESRSIRLLYTVAGSGIGLVFLLVFAFLGWRFLKRWYLRRVLNMRPEVEGYD